MAKIIRVNKKQFQNLDNFMAKHSDLAKGTLLASAEGRATSYRLWETLKIELNLKGPPIKSVGDWRRIWALRKYRAKEKLLKNKNSLSKTHGDPLDCTTLIAEEEDIVEVCGLEKAVSGMVGVRSFGANSKNNHGIEQNNNTNDVILDAEVEAEAEAIPSTSKTPNQSVSKKKFFSKEDAYNKQVKFNNDYLVSINELNKNIVGLSESLSNFAVQFLNQKDEELGMQKRMLELKEKELEILEKKKY